MSKNCGGREGEVEGESSGCFGPFLLLTDRLLLVDGWCGMNTYLQYAAVFDPAAGFQARRLLVVTDGWW